MPSSGGGDLLDIAAAERADARQVGTATRRCKRIATIFGCNLAVGIVALGIVARGVVARGAIARGVVDGALLDIVAAELRHRRKCT